MDLNKYFADAQGAINEGFLGADGFYLGASGIQGFNANGTYGGIDAGLDAPYYFADGIAPAPAAPLAQAQSAKTSQPYIVSVQNTDTNTPHTATLFGANYNLVGATNYGNGPQIVLSTTVTGVTYAQLLTQSQNKTFEVGLIYQNCGSSAQQISPISIITKDANGNQTTNNIYPTIDQYANQTSVNTINFAFIIDGATSLQFVLGAGVTTILSFYPKTTLNPVRAIAGRTPMTNYGSPNIVRLPLGNMSQGVR